MTNPLPTYPWNKQLSESDQAYEAFKIYLNSESPRRLQDTANAVGKSIQLMKRWSTYHNWRTRASHFDSFTTQKQIEQVHTSVNEAMKAARLQLMREEWEDYKLMRSDWANSFEVAQDDPLLTVEDQAKLVRTRIAIDDFGRRALHMPLSYSAKEMTDKEDEETDTPYFLSPDGIIEGKLTGGESTEI